MTQLVPHFVMAREIQRQVADAERQEALARRVLDWLPLGVAIVTPMGTLISANHRLHQIVRRSSCLALTAGRLNSRPSSSLGLALAQVCTSAVGNPETLRLEEGDEHLSLLVARLDKGMEQPQVVIWVATQEPVGLEEASLRALYGMSAAEGRLTRRLMQGETLEEAAQSLHVSINTVRTQLQAIFSKTGVSRQSELLRAIYSSPLWLDSRNEEFVNSGESEKEAQVSGDAGMRLSDGRWLAWADLGDPKGVPFIFNHVITGTRHFRHPDLALLYDHHLRLIMPERPGTGDSDPQSGRTVQDWADDVKAMTNHLDIQRFVVVGFSEGTPYALALARSLPEQVIQVFIVSATPPIDGTESLHDHRSIPFRSVLLVAQHTPWLLPPLMRIMIRNARKNIYRFIEQMTRGMSEQDQAVFAEPSVRENYAHGLMSAIAHGENHLVIEALLAVHGWKQEDAYILQPLRFYHGSDDWFYSLEGLKTTLSCLPNATLTTIPGGGHLLMYSHWHTLIPLMAADLR